MQNKISSELPAAITIRKAKAGDVDAVHRIKKEQFRNPWKKNQFIAELSHSLAHFLVALDDATGEIAGYILFWIVEETVEIHDIAVKEEFKRKGIAAALMDMMLRQAKLKKAREIFLEVRKSNTPAITLYEKYGFNITGNRKNYFNNPIEDALVYKLEI